MTHSTPRHCCLSNPLHSHRFQIRNTAYKKYLCTSSKYILCSRRKRNTSSRSSHFPRHFVPKDQNKVCAHDKNKNRAEFWVQINLFKGELWCINTNFAKESPNIIATNFPILVALSYKLRSNSAIEVSLKCD